MASTDAKTLIAAIRDQSKGKYKVISAGKHLKVIHAEGQLKGRSVVDSDGPLIISGSPSESRNRELAAHRLMRAGVLEWDPWKGRPAKGGKTYEEIEQEQKQGRRLQQTVESHARIEKSQQVRSDLELLMVKIGGSWDKYGFKKEFARTCLYWLKEDRDSDYGLSESGFPQQIYSLSKGNAVSENARTALELFIRHINQQINPRSYYMHLAGLSKDAKPVRQLPAKVVRSTKDGSEEIVLLPDTEDGPLIESRPSVWDFVGLAAVHERNGLKWSMGLSIDEYAELQRAVGYLEALVVTTDQGRGEKALQTLSNFLIKMAEARFYTMMNREEAREGGEAKD